MPTPYHTCALHSLYAHYSPHTQGECSRRTMQHTTPLPIRRIYLRSSLYHWRQLVSLLLPRPQSHWLEWRSLLDNWTYCDICFGWHRLYLYRKTAHKKCTPSVELKSYRIIRDSGSYSMYLRQRQSEQCTYPATFATP